jgi:hypothetical protein
MTDHLIRAIEVLAKVAERLAIVDARLGEGVERIIVAVAALAAQLKKGGERAAKAERALGDRLDALPTSEALSAMFADLRAREEDRHGAQVAALARIEARLAAIETRPAPTTWADLFGRHPALVLGLAAVLAALAGWLGGQVPTLPGRDEPTPPTAVLPGAGSRLMGDRRLADGSEG